MRTDGSQTLVPQPPRTERPPLQALLTPWPPEPSPGPYEAYKAGPAVLPGFIDGELGLGEWLNRAEVAQFLRVRWAWRADRSVRPSSSLRGSGVSTGLHAGSLTAGGRPGTTVWATTQREEARGHLGTQGIGDGVPVPGFRHSAPRGSSDGASLA